MKLSKEQQEMILEVRRTTKLNLATIAFLVGSSRGSIQRLCELNGLGNVGLRNKTKPPVKKRIRKRNATLTLTVACTRAYIRVYKRGAKDRGLEFDLSEEECLMLFSGNCYYCGIAPTNKKHFRGSFPQNGIDRKDNSKGYTIDNCVSCCKDCNLSKRDMTVEEFEGWLERVFQHKVKTGQFHEKSAGLCVSGGEVQKQKWVHSQGPSSPLPPEVQRPEG